MVRGKRTQVAPRQLDGPSAGAQGSAGDHRRPNPQSEEIVDGPLAKSAPIDVAADGPGALRRGAAAERVLPAAGVRADEDRAPGRCRAGEELAWR
jgi:hypothetical protein